MNMTYFRKKDEAINGGDFSQSQRPSYTQYPASGFLGSQNYHQRYGTGDQSQFGVNGMTAGDYSQNISGCIPVLGGENGFFQQNNSEIKIKQEIDLLELCRDLNEDTFKTAPNATLEKKASVNKLAQAKVQPKKKVQGSGNFNLTTSKGAPKIVKQEEIVKQEPSIVLPIKVEVKNQLRPEVNKKYDITPQIQQAIINPSQGSSIAGFMGIKQEEEINIAKQEDEQQIVRPNNKKKPAAANRQQTNKLLSIAEFASNFQSTDDFFNQDCQMKDEERDTVIQPIISDEDDVLQSKGKINKGQSSNIGQSNKKRKNNEISKQDMTDELDELLPEDPNVKRRKLNQSAHDQDKPHWANQKKPQGGLSSSFLINKKQQSSNNSSILSINKPRESITHLSAKVENGNQLFSDSQIMEDRFQKETESIVKNSLKFKCQNAYDEFLKDQKASDDFLVVRLLSKVKKNGIQWTIGELADYHLKNEIHIKNQKLLEALKGSCKKVRIMMPPDGFNAYGNKGLHQFGRYSSSSSSGGSTAERQSTVINQTAFQMNSIVMVDSPTLMFHDLNFQLNNSASNEFDLCYLTVMAKSLRHYEGAAQKRSLMMN